MAYYSDRPSSGGGRIRRDIRTPTSPDSGLTILPSDDGFAGKDSPQSAGKSARRSTPRSSNHSYSRTPRRTPTPTKQVNLQATRRKEEPDVLEDTPFDWQEHERLESARLQSYRSSHGNASQRRSHDPKSSSYHKHASESTSDSAAEEMLKKCYKTDDVSDLMEKMNFSKTENHINGARTVQETGEQSEEEGATGGREKEKKTKASSHNRRVDIDDSDEFDTDLEDGEEEEEVETEQEKEKAPNELFMEFLDCVMKQEWKTAQNLCRMILLYEPDHPEAKEFQSTIEEKVRLEEELANMSSDDDDEDGETDDDEDDDDDSDDSGESDDESDEDDEQDQAQAPEHDDTTSVADSGIASVW